MILNSNAKLQPMKFPCHTQMGTFLRRGVIVPFWVWHNDWDSLNFAELKLTNMTSEEKRLIADCRVMIIGASDFIDNVTTELYWSGFKSINIVSGNDVHTEIGPVDMVAEYTGEACTHIKGNAAIPIIYPFDFVDGAGAIVIMPGDDNELQNKDNLRLWAAEYMVGYCAFWNMEGCDWLHSALPKIREGKTSEAAQRTATHICARIAANIAVGREVKHLPRFYLCMNLE